MVDRGGLENRWVYSPGGSNPSLSGSLYPSLLFLSVKKELTIQLLIRELTWVLCNGIYPEKQDLVLSNGEVPEWPKGVAC